MPRRVVVDSDSDSDHDLLASPLPAATTTDGSSLGALLDEVASPPGAELAAKVMAPPLPQLQASLSSSPPSSSSEEEEAASFSDLDASTSSAYVDSPAAAVAPRVRPQREASAYMRTAYSGRPALSPAAGSGSLASPATVDDDGVTLSFDDASDSDASPISRAAPAATDRAAGAASDASPIRHCAVVTLRVRNGAPLASLLPISIAGSGACGRIIGREPNSELPTMVLCDCDGEVSSTHARLEVWRDGARCVVTLTDLDSTNGTVHKRAGRVGSALVPNVPRILLKGDCVRIGSRTFCVLALTLNDAVDDTLVPVPAEATAALAAEAESSSSSDDESDSDSAGERDDEEEIEIENGSESDGGAWVFEDDAEEVDLDDAEVDVEERREADLTRLDVIRMQQAERREGAAGDDGTAGDAAGRGLDRDGSESGGAVAVLRRATQLSAVSRPQHSWRFDGASGDRVLCGFPADAVQAGEEEPHPFVLSGGVHDRLMQHQLDGVAWMYRVRHLSRAAPQHADGVTQLRGAIGGVDARGARTSGALICDDMGLGKTVQIAAFLGALFGSSEKVAAHSAAGEKGGSAALRILIAVPKVVFEQWEEELHLWFRGALGSDDKYRARRFCTGNKGKTRGGVKQRDRELIEVAHPTTGFGIVLATTSLLVNGALVQALLAGRTRDAAAGAPWPAPWHGGNDADTFDVAKGPAAVPLFDYLIIDEAHEIKSGKKLHYELSRFEALFGSRHKLLLTGTPIMNKLEELYTLLDFAVGRPFLGTHDDFKADFGNVIEGGRLRDSTKDAISSAEHTLKELLQHVRAVVLRRMWDGERDEADRVETTSTIAAADARDATLATNATAWLERCSKRIPSALPPIAEIDLWLKLTPKQAFCYAAIPDIIEGPCPTFATLHCLKAVCSHPSLLPLARIDQILEKGYPRGVGDHVLPPTHAPLRPSCDTFLLGEEEEDDDENDEEATAVEHDDDDPADLIGRKDPCSASSKLAMLALLLPLLRKEGHRVVIFSRSKDMLALVGSAVMAPTMHTSTPRAERLSYEIVVGDMASDNRVAIFERFNKPRSASRAIFALLITEQLGQVGLNLTGADVVISLDPWWNPAVTNQAMHRVHRIKQTRPVLAIRVYVEDTVEEVVRRRERFKQDLDSATTDTLGEKAERRDGIAIVREFTQTEMAALFIEQPQRAQAIAVDQLQQLGVAGVTDTSLALPPAWIRTAKAATGEEFDAGGLADHATVDASIKGDFCALLHEFATAATHREAAPLSVRVCSTQASVERAAAGEGGSSSAAAPASVPAAMEGDGDDDAEERCDLVDDEAMEVETPFPVPPVDFPAVPSGGTFATDTAAAKPLLALIRDDVHFQEGSPRRILVPHFEGGDDAIDTNTTPLSVSPLDVAATFFASDAAVYATPRAATTPATPATVRYQPNPNATPFTVRYETSAPELTPPTVRCDAPISAAAQRFDELKAEMIGSAAPLSPRSLLPGGFAHNAATPLRSILATPKLLPSAVDGAGTPPPVAAQPGFMCLPCSSDEDSNFEFFASGEDEEEMTEREDESDAYVPSDDEEESVEDEGAENVPPPQPLQAPRRRVGFASPPPRAGGPSGVSQAVGGKTTRKARSNLVGTVVVKKKSKPMVMTDKQFARARKKRLASLFAEFDDAVFGGRLAAKLSAAGVTWSKKLRTTAGETSLRKFRVSNTRTAAIVISIHVCTNDVRLRETLLHEMCHMAAWVLGEGEGCGQRTFVGGRTTFQCCSPHGRCFKDWGRAVQSVYPSITIGTCHTYTIHKRYR